MNTESYGGHYAPIYMEYIPLAILLFALPTLFTGPIY